jgi:hypothetical protein
MIHNIYIMNYLFNFENYKHLWKTKHPFPTIDMALTEPKPEGCVLILSNPIVNDKRRIYMAHILQKLEPVKITNFKFCLLASFTCLKSILGI